MPSIYLPKSFPPSLFEIFFWCLVKIISFSLSKVIKEDFWKINFSLFMFYELFLYSPANDALNFDLGTIFIDFWGKKLLPLDDAVSKHELQIYFVLRSHIIASISVIIFYETIFRVIFLKKFFLNRGSAQDGKTRS